MEYDYLCENCTHEFDWEQGVRFIGVSEVVCCPNCNSSNLKK